MSRYMNPSIAQEYPRVDPPKREYSDYIRQASHLNGILVGVGDRGIFKVAADLSKQSDFDDMQVQYKQGAYLTLRFYAVPESVFVKNQHS